MRISFLFMSLLILCLVADEGLGMDPVKSNTTLVPACPDRPSCVSSLADQASRRVEPFPLKGSPSESLALLAEIIRSMPRTKITSFTATMLKAEFRSILGFVDDVFFAVSENRKLIHVRSASRVGSWDLGVNRRRVERIRKKYEAVEN